MVRYSSLLSCGVPMAFALAIAGIGCVEDQATRAKPNDEQQSGIFTGGEGNTHSHMGDLGAGVNRNIFDILAQRRAEGPPEVSSRMHSCQKLQIAAVSNMLVSLGVDLSATGNPPTAGQLLDSGGGALGAANYDARVGEAIVWTNAGAAKLFDIFVQAAPDIISNMPKVTHCQVNGVAPVMFDAQNRCNAAAISCIIGRPATPEHVTVCNLVVERASNVERGKRIAIASLLAAAHSCE